MTSRPSTAAPILAVLAVVLVLLAAYLPDDREALALGSGSCSLSRGMAYIQLEP